MQPKVNQHFPNNISALISAVILVLLPLLAVSENAVNSVSTKSVASAASPKKLPSPQLLAKNTKPAVVRIIDGCQAKGYWFNNRKTYDLSVVSSTGSGYFVHPNGYIVTNAHVIPDTQEQEECQRFLIQQFQNKLLDDGQNPETATHLNLFQFQSIHHVNLFNGDQLPFEIIKVGAPVGQGVDVAMIKVDMTNAPFLKLADSGRVEDLDHVIAVGYPATVDLKSLDNSSFFKATFTDGRVSSQKVMKDGSPVIQITAPTSPGSSGGPVVNEEGEVVGMVTFGPSNSENHTFIVPSNTIKSFLMQQAGVLTNSGSGNSPRK